MSDLDFQYGQPLKAFNTLAVEANAEVFCCVENAQQIQQATEYSQKHNKPIQVLGGGSNVLLPQNIAGLVVHPVSQGVALVEDGYRPLVRIAAGENWHNLVEKTLSQGWHGLENLALIPGNVGAAPIQNIGAYGVELNDLFHSLEAVHLITGECLTMSKQDCQFGYRDSIFKNALKGQLMISSVTLQLRREPELNIEYPALKQALDNLDVSHITPLMVAQAVTDIRRSKLPDPAITPNVGSFFKNPVVTLAEAKKIRIKHPGLVGYSTQIGFEKLAAGWLIEQAGWKGRQFGNVAVHSQQALVLVNKGSATIADVLALAQAIQRDVAEKFGIRLEIEPQCLADG